MEQEERQPRPLADEEEKRSLLHRASFLQPWNLLRGSRNDAVLETEQVESSACMTLRDPGVYVAVLAAAFGGVQIEVERGGMVGRNVSPKVHPGLMYFITVPVFIVQISAVLALRFGMDINLPVIRDEDTEDRLVMHLKLIMVGVLQLMQYTEMISSVRYIVLVMNPVTWIDLKHPSASEWLGNRLAEGNRTSWLQTFFRPLFLAPFPAVSLAMEFFISYMVCVDSMSLILSSRSVKDLIFNSLVMTFIVELNRVFWAVYSIVFHLNVDEGCLALDERTWISEKDFGFTEEARQRFLAPYTLQRIVQYFPFLRRGHGAQAHEYLVSALWIWIMYVQQLFALLYALETNVLPVARDICTQWRFIEGRTTWLALVGKSFSWISTHVLLFNVEEATLDVAKHKLLNKCMPGQDYYRMANSNRWEMLLRHPVPVFFGVVVPTFLLVCPQVLHFVHSKVFPIRDEAAEGMEEMVHDLEAEDRNLREIISKQQQAIDELQDDHKQLQQKVKELESQKSK